MRYRAWGDLYFCAETVEELARKYWKAHRDAPRTFEEFKRLKAEGLRVHHGKDVRTDTTGHFITDLIAADAIQQLPEDCIAYRCGDEKLFVSMTRAEMAEELWMSQFAPPPTLREWMDDFARRMDEFHGIELRKDTPENLIEDAIDSGIIEVLPKK